MVAAPEVIEAEFFRSVAKGNRRLSRRRKILIPALARASRPISLKDLLALFGEGADKKGSALFALRELVKLGVAVRAIDGWIPALSNPPSMILTHDLDSDTYTLAPLSPEARAFITQDPAAIVLVEVTTGQKPKT